EAGEYFAFPAPPKRGPIAVRWVASNVSSSAPRSSSTPSRHEVEDEAAELARPSAGPRAPRAAPRRGHRGLAAAGTAPRRRLRQQALRRPLVGGRELRGAGDGRHHARPRSGGRVGNGPLPAVSWLPARAGALRASSRTHR